MDRGIGQIIQAVNPNIPRSVEETLRVVTAIKMVDEAGGSALAPADWVSTQPVIKNSRSGILKYYKEKYEDKTQETGLWLSAKKLFGGHVQLQSSTNSTVNKTLNLLFLNLYFGK